MHLVDAIRKATRRTEATKVPEEASGPGTPPEPPAADAAWGPDDELWSQPAFEISGGPPVAGASDVYEPAPVSPVTTASRGSVVRLEIFLSREQTHEMLRSVLQGTHTVMTLREAAQHLRVSQETLTNMAESGEIPAFMVEGRWKFPRQAVDEWITLKTLQKRPSGQQENRDAA